MQKAIIKNPTGQGSRGDGRKMHEEEKIEEKEGEKKDEETEKEREERVSGQLDAIGGHR